MTRPTRPQVTLLKTDVLDRICVRNHVPPSPDLAPFVAIAWTMSWKLGEGEEFTQQVLPNPSVQIVVRSGEAEVIGIVTGAFSTTLSAQGFIFGLKFRPCGFYPIAGEAVALFTDRRFPITRILPEVDSREIADLALREDRSGLMALFEGELRKRNPVRDETGEKLEALISHMETESSMLTVDQAAEWFGASRRTLQRLFHLHVGVSPKWILRRFRLKEAAARIDMREPESMAELAQELGYYDQAHLIRDFRELVGKSPSAYGRPAERDN